jgi:predicted DNA-binding transcriptional regulator AlpA
MRVRMPAASDEAQAQAAPEPIPLMLTKALILRHYLPIGERTLDRWTSARIFPAPDLSMGGKVRLWQRSTVEEWIQSQRGRG